ncbi:MAG: riboflavin biosynthesis protein RibF [Clostridia bacterium]|nr:riboflavin biosynthesis protein RibF [Clostridia bacterium]
MAIDIRLIDLVRGCEVCIPDDVDFVVALGNFDGVHRAHAALLDTGLCLAEQIGYHQRKHVLCAAWTFAAPSGDYFLTPPPAHLTTLQERLSLFAANGITHAFLADFASLRDCSPQAFMEDVLIKRCHAIGVACGYNFHFGKNGMGDASLLEERFRECAAVLPKTCFSEKDPTAISSSLVRTLLTEGTVEHAEEALGYPYFLHAPVLHGKQLGRTLGLPTINQCFPFDKLIPKCGIYATLCILPDGNVYPGVSNVGRRPTVDGNGAVNCETHIPDISLDLYEKNVTVCFIRRLRDEQQFPSLNALQHAIRQDVEHMRSALSPFTQSDLSARCDRVKSTIARLPLML